MKSIYLILFFSLSTFVLNAQYNTIGNTFQDGDCYSLTGAVNWNSGALWHLETMNLNESFDIWFNLSFGTQDVNGADGIAFVMQPISNSEGGSGGGMGYVGISPSLAIEMDTHQNTDWADPTYDHIGIQANGNGNHSTADMLVAPTHIVAGQDNVEDGNFYYFHLQWDATSNNLRCWINCDLRIDYTADIIADIFGGDPNVFWGFTSATGGLNNAHTACPIFVSFEQNIPDVNLCDGQTQQVFANQNFINHTWSPPGFFDNPNVYNPNLVPSPGVNELYWEASDPCGTVIRDTFILDVSTTVIPSLPPSIEVCYGEVLNFDSYGFDNIQWNTPATPNPIITNPLNVNVDVTLDGCSENQLVSVTVKPPPKLFNTDVSVCPNTTITLDGVFDNVVWNSPAGASGNAFTATTDVLVDVDLDLDGCTQNHTFLVSIAPEPTANTQTNVCADVPFLITGNFDAITWNSPALTGSEISISTDTNLNFDATLGDCTLNFNFPVSVESSPNLNMPTSICAGETLTVDGVFDNLTWVQPSNTGNTILIDEDTDIEIEANLGGCTRIFNFTVFADPLPELDMDYTACKNTSTTITGDYDELEWLDASNIGSSIMITEPNTYQIEASLGACKQSFTITTDTLDCAPLVDCILLIPNAFSPNNDGMNDQFRPQITSCKLDDYKLSIYNRWGQQLFNSNDINIGWLGTNNGEPVEIGVYIYVVEYKANGLNQSNAFKGNVTVVR